MKKFFSLMAAVLFAGSMMATDATIAKGTTNSYDDVTINGKSAVKMGKSSAGGNMTITVGAGATSLKFHAVAWKGEGNQAVTITAPEGVTITPAQITVTANNALTGTAKAFTVTPEEDYEFSFAITGASEGATFTLASAKRAIVWEATYETADTPVDNSGYYLVGTMNEWAPAAGYKFSANSATEGEYKLNITLAAGDEFKVVYSADGVANTTWYPDLVPNYVVDEQHAGVKTVYFRADGQGGEDWYYNTIFVERNPINLGAMSIADFLAAANTKDTCVLTGIVANIKTNTDGSYNKYGNFDLVEGEASVYIYGLLTAAGQAQQFQNMDIDAGDQVTLKGTYTLYHAGQADEKAEVVNAIFVSRIKAADLPTAIDNTNVEAKAVKFFENGQLIILKNGVYYNAQGAVVR